MKILFPLFVLCLAMALSVGVCVAPASEQPPKVAIVPFTTGGQENIDYIAHGLRDMIASRIATGSQVAVIDQSLVRTQVPGTGREALSLEKLMEIGRTLRAEYVIFGSMATMGDGLSVAISMLSVSAGGPAHPVFTQNLEMDDVIPRLQLIAHEIRDEIERGVGKPGAVPAVAPAPGEPGVKGEEGRGVGTAPAGDGNASAGLSQGEGPAEMIPEHLEGEAEKDTGNQAEQQEEGLKHLLFNRKADVNSAPENPVDQESLKDLQQDSGAFP